MKTRSLGVSAIAVSIHRVRNPDFTVSFLTDSLLERKLIILNYPLWFNKQSKDTMVRRSDK